MVAAENLIVNLRTPQLIRNSVRHHKIINTPTRILLTRLKAVAPPAVLNLLRMQITEAVRKTRSLQLTELSTLLIRKACILAVSLRILQINLLSRHIQITADNNRLLCIQLLQISTEHILPHHAVIKTRQAILGIRRIHRHQIKALKLQRNHTTFLIVLLLPQAIGNSQRLNPRKNSSTAVSLTLRTVPILLVAGEYKIRLLALHLRFLQANNIRRSLLQKFGKALRHAGTQTVNIPGI